MNFELSSDQIKLKKKCKAFVEENILPFTEKFEDQGKIPGSLINKMGMSGFLCSALPDKKNGNAINSISYSIINEEIGKGSSSVRSLITVQDMVAFTISKFGTDEQKNKWIKKLRSGDKVASFCLSEEKIGSDAKNIETTAEQLSDSFKINGKKKWITFGQIANVLLVFAKCDDKPTAFLIESDTPGIKVKPITGILGTNASMLAEISFNNCVVPKSAVVGKIGAAFSFIMPSALALGRFSVACGCVGIISGCLEASVKYVQERKQFGKALMEHQLIQQMITNMAVNLKAARLLCYNAGFLLDKNDPKSVTEILAAKYFSSVVALQAANDAVQLHGANGLTKRYPVQRYLRDAKVMEIIEGSTQIQQVLISKHTIAEKISEGKNV